MSADDAEQDAGNAHHLERALQETWDAIRGQQPGVPAATVRLEASPRVRRVSAEARWRLAAGTSEVVFGAWWMAGRTAEGVLEALLRQAVHGLSAARGLKDTSRHGAYHNEVFRRHADELGLDCQRDPLRGWGVTSLRSITVARYLGHTFTLARELQSFVAPPAPPPGRSWAAAVCQCGRRIRISRRALAVAPIRCDACRAEFQPPAEVP